MVSSPYITQASADIFTCAFVKLDALHACFAK